MDKIAYMCSEYPAISHTFIYREVQAIRDEGIEVFTISIKPTSHIKKLTIAEQEEIAGTFYVKSIPIIKGLKNILSVLLFQPTAFVCMLGYTLKLMYTHCTPKIKLIAYFAEALIIIPWLTKNKVKHIHVHFANPASTVALIASKGRTVQFSMSIHGPDEFYNMEKNLLSEKVISASFVRCITDFCKSQLQYVAYSEHWSKLKVVRCGIDTERYSRIIDSTKKNKPYKLLTVARLAPAKGYYTLLESIEILKSRGYEFILDIIGGGPFEHEIKRTIENKQLHDIVYMHGPAGQDKVLEYYRNADIFVLSSYAEGLPGVLMEAMSMGIPCVATRITGIPEMLDDGVNGLLATPSDPIDFAQCVEKLITDEALRTKIAQNAPKIVTDKYNIFKNCAKMAEIFTKL